MRSLVEAAGSIACSVTKRALPIRTLAVFSLGVAVLIGILYYASTVDGRPPTVRSISLTQHLGADPEMALTTTSIEVDFSEPVAHATAQEAFAITPAVGGSFSWSAASLTFTPASSLPLRTAFEVTIGAGVVDSAGNRMAAGSQSFHFTTVGNPSVVDTDPADADTEVPLNTPIVIDFSTLMDTTSVERALELRPAIQLRLHWTRERLTVTPVAPLEANRRYALTIGVGAHDQAGTPLARPFQLSFQTVVSGLAAGMIVPADDGAGIAVTTPIAVVFDQALDPDSVRDDLLTITPQVPGSLAAEAAPGAAGLLDGGLRVLRFEPSGPLDPNTTYEVSLAPGLLGADGAGMPAGLSWTFTTGSPTATLSNQIVFLSDRAGVANLWAMNPDGTNQRQLSAELSPIVYYDVAPDGRSFVVGDGATIVWQRVDGSARRSLTDTGLVEFDPAFSPDGSMLTFGRADPVLGSGLGLWIRDADGSDPRPVEMPEGPTATPSPEVPVRVPLLRAPRISPDGTALAFVDERGGVSILDLELKQLSTAAFVALSAPTWLPDGTGIAVAGLPAGAGVDPRAYPPRSPVLPLDPASQRLTAAQLSALRVVHLGRFSSSVAATAFGPGAARPVVDAGGRHAFIRLEGSDAVAGSLWLSTTADDAGDEVRLDPGAPAGSASFAPQASSMVIGRVPRPTDDPARVGGVWLLNVVSGAAQQLSTDGWQPRWPP